MRGGLLIVQLIITPSPKQETVNFRGIVYFLFLISIKLSLKWALVETSMTKLIFLYLIAWGKSRGSTQNFWHNPASLVFVRFSKCWYQYFRMNIDYKEKIIKKLFGGLKGANSPKISPPPPNFDVLSASNRLNY